MNRDEFMRELEYLLADIPDEEKADAVGYYRDYLEEAGPEGEEAVIREFGSPERIAAIIRSDLAGNLEDGGEFTETGYQDERFRDPNTQVTKRYDLPEAAERQYQSKQETGTRPPNTNKTVKIILWIILIIVASPMIFGIGGGILGVIAGAFGILVACIVALAAFTFAFLAAGLVMLIFGIVYLVMHPLDGVLIVGLGILFLGIGFLCLALCVVFYGKFLPFLVRSIVNGISRLVYGRRNRA